MKKDLIYWEKLWDSPAEIRWEEFEIQDIRVGIMIQAVECLQNPENGMLGKWKSELREKYMDLYLKRRSDEHTIVFVNDRKNKQHACNLQLLSYKRKELLSHLDGVLQYMKMGLMEGKRHSFLLLLEDIGWSEAELTEIIMHAKKYYEDIYILDENSFIDREIFNAYFYDEYGLEICWACAETISCPVFDTVFFLLKDDKKSVSMTRWINGYVVSLLDDDMEKIRKKWNRNKVDDQMSPAIKRIGKLYAGFAYEYCGRSIKREVALLLCYCQQLRKKTVFFPAEKNISIVAIYELE